MKYKSVSLGDFNKRPNKSVKFSLRLLIRSENVENICLYIEYIW